MSEEWTPVSDPPKKPGWYLVDNPEWDCIKKAAWIHNVWEGLSPTHWRELPPRAPQPDMFEEFWNRQTPSSVLPDMKYVAGFNFLTKESAKLIWDAAMKAKEQGK